MGLRHTGHLSPDEAIAEFYTSTEIFESKHAGMPDLLVPRWAANVEDFVERHRRALESDRVSCALFFHTRTTNGHVVSYVSGSIPRSRRSATISGGAPKAGMITKSPGARSSNGDCRSARERRPSRGERRPGPCV